MLSTLMLSKSGVDVSSSVPVPAHLALLKAERKLLVRVHDRLLMAMVSAGVKIEDLSQQIDTLEAR